MMTLIQTAAAFIQQAPAEGLTVLSTAPFKVRGTPEAIARYAAIMAHLREKAADHPSKPDFDAAVATAGELCFGPQERQLLPRVGKPASMVWVNSSCFTFGRLEAVVPGIALVSVHPNPVLPADPIARWEARTKDALPFHVGLVELDEIDQVVSDGVGAILGIRPRPPVTDRASRAEERAS